MPRTARIYIEGGVFHILARGNNKQAVFHSDEDFTAYKMFLSALREEHPFRLYHYCLMTNHIHLIVETNQKTDLSRYMKRLNLSYYNHYRRRYGYAGHFWQDRFKSLLISRDEYLIACGLYIERNPVRAKMVDSPRLYKHSSYNYYAHGQKDDLVDVDPIYEGLASGEKERQAAYRGLLLEEKLGITEKAFKRLFLGADNFVRAMERRSGVRNARVSVGRPKNN